MSSDNSLDPDDSITYKIIDYLVKNGIVHLDEVTAHIDQAKTEAVGRDAIRERTKFLKGLGLLKSGKEGYCFSGKGVRFFRRWLNEKEETN